MILIVKDMKLPQSCSTCRFSYFTVGIKKRCEISGDEVNPLLDCRETNCPLAEIPTPYGRLIDADATIARLKYLYCENCGNSCERCPWGAFIKYIESRPTIVDRS